MSQTLGTEKNNNNKKHIQEAFIKQYTDQTQKETNFFVLTKLTNITLRGLLGFENMKYEKIHLSFVRHVLFGLL